MNKTWKIFAAVCVVGLALYIMSSSRIFNERFGLGQTKISGITLDFSRMIPNQTAHPDAIALTDGFLQGLKDRATVVTGTGDWWVRLVLSCGGGDHSNDMITLLAGQRGESGADLSLAFPRGSAKPLGFPEILAEMVANYLAHAPRIPIRQKQPDAKRIAEASRIISRDASLFIEG